MTTDALVEEIRQKALRGIAPLKVFAKGVDKTPRTIHNYISQGLPVVYIGRTPYPKIEEGIEWLRSRRDVSGQEAPRGRGRPRKAA